MIEKSYPLSVLVRAVTFRNLSSASTHVGLSQPQLSRVIAKLEAELGMELLDRQVRRKACWTPQALKLAETFHRHQRRLEAAIKSLQTGGKMRQVHVGALEGLKYEAVKLCEAVFKLPAVEFISLDVFDRTELEAKFLSGELDIIFDTRVPNMSKPRFMKRIGYQSLDSISLNDDYAVFSSFEYAQQRKKPTGKTLVSNSLAVRKMWFENFGGKGWLPSEISARPKRNGDEVLVLGGDWLDAEVWRAGIAPLTE